MGVGWGVGGGRVKVQVGPQGDEPHYLMVADSLIRDHDLSLERDYAEGRYRDFHPAPLAPHYRVRGKGGEIYSLHAVGLSLIVLPAYAVASYAGASLLIALLAAWLRAPGPRPARLRVGRAARRARRARVCRPVDRLRHRAGAFPFPPLRLFRPSSRLRPAPRAGAGRPSHRPARTPLRSGVRPPRVRAPVRPRRAGLDPSVATLPPPGRRRPRPRPALPLVPRPVPHLA